MDIVTLAASKKYTDKKLAESAAVGIKYEIVDSLPSSGKEQTIYFVKNESSWINNYYDEYVWISSSGSFEKIGSTQLDDFIQNPSAAEVGQTIVVKEVNEEGKPIAWEMAELPEQAQADWNQNDSAAADYIKNRPFYEGTTREQLYSYIGDVITKYDDTYYVADLTSPLNRIYSGLNITVVINCDGIENTYTNVPITEYYIGAGVYEFDYLGGKDGYPFKITSNKLYVTASGYYTVYIYKESTIIEKIPSKFIPTDPSGVYSGSTTSFATNNQIKRYVDDQINDKLSSIDIAEEGAY